MAQAAHTAPAKAGRARVASGNRKTTRETRASSTRLVSKAVVPYQVKRLHFATLLKTEPAHRIALARDGVSAAWLSELATRMGIPQDRVFAYLGIPRSTAIRKIQQSKLLSTDEGERVLGIARLVGLVEKIVRESGEPKGFDAARWLAGWLEQALPALGGQKPGELLDTATGQQLVAGLLSQIQSGAYA